MNAKYIFGLICAAAVGAGAAYLGFSVYHSNELDFTAKNPQLVEVYDEVSKNYYKDYDSELVEYSMISGMLNGFDDRFMKYTPAYYSEEAYVNSAPSTRTSGFKIAQDDKSRCILVTEVKDGSQAQKMGLRQGDVITAINGESVAETGYYNIISELLGKDGTSMTLEIDRNGEKSTIDFVRANEMERYSEVEYRLIGDTFYYRFNGFAGCERDNFLLRFNELNDGNVKNIVLDLRQNTGGFTSDTIEMFDLFYGEGATVKNVAEKSDKVESWSTSSEITLDQNVAVLVSGGTYSSGEILAALFQDTGRGTVIGTQTGGKGVYQETIMMNDWSLVPYVAGYYYVNDIPNYNGVGITPDIILDMDSELIGTDDDIQLKKALEILAD